MAIYELDGHSPKLGKNTWVADSAQVIGQVTLEENVSVWFGTVIRGDSEHSHLGGRVHIIQTSMP
jgi:carbonic anhydrase/acetyltransferase-like protein (isoleucine patch superfamily)